MRTAIKKYTDSFRDDNGELRNGMILTHLYLIHNATTFGAFIFGLLVGGTEQGVIWFSAIKACFHSVFFVYSICSIVMKKYL
ncbi:MAG: hypothetical protein EU981_02360 [Candidatus Liberibacter ctenarytainae]|uniref:Uncharacterized protein n=1 Tax=Candidatus Liberibacter ctenarytainae TaxID=2020335 RepID=A0A937ACD7_9HYPH|nr:hypothetical protein [Candidatus Liberibacter ctenarytainae]